MAIYAAVAAIAAGTFMQIASEVRTGQRQAAEARFAGQQQAAQAEQSALMSEREAQVAENERLAEEQKLAFDIKTRRRIFQRRFAQRRARIGASGVEFSGSPLLVAIDEAREAELDIEAMRFESETRGRALEDEAALRRFQAEEFRRAGTTALAVSRRRARIAREEATFRAIGAGISGGAQAGRTLAG